MSLKYVFYIYVYVYVHICMYTYTHIQKHVIQFSQRDSLCDAHATSHVLKFHALVLRKPEQGGERPYSQKGTTAFVGVKRSIPETREGINPRSWLGTHSSGSGPQLGFDKHITLCIILQCLPVQNIGAECPTNIHCVDLYWR